MVEWLAGNRIRGTSAERTVGTSGISLTGTQTTSGTTATSLSVSINVGDYSNKALIVCVTQQSGSTTSVKVGSNSFTNVDIQNGGASGTGSQRTEIWYLLDSDITNNASNQIDWVGSAGSRVSIGVYSLNNVNQTVSGNFVSSSAYGTASTTTGAVNSVDSGGFIIDILSANSSTQPTDTLTEGWNIFISTNRYAVSQYNASPSTDNDMFYSNVTGAEWAWSGVAIKPIPAIPPLILALQSPSVGGWVELARTTLGSSGDLIAVSGLADKRYYMVLTDKIGDGSANSGCWARLNSDTGSNYATRMSHNGGADSTGVSQANGGAAVSATPTPAFGVRYVANIATKEKLAISSFVAQNTAGAGTAPLRRENVFKWANTSDAVSVITEYNADGGDFATGSEVVVLGWDPTDTHTTNFWEELASVDTGAGEVLDSGTFAAKKYLWFQFDIVVDINNNTNATIRFNSDQNGNYARRLSQNGMATDNTAVGQTHMTFTYSGGKRVFGNYFVINNSSSEKLAIGHTNAIGTTSNSTSEGAGVAPRRVEVVGKWANTSSQITQIEVLDTAQGDLGLTSGTIKVWGSD